MECIIRWGKGVTVPEDVAGKAVLEVGSFNVNGSFRPFLEEMGPDYYLGVDMREGPDVDEVLDAVDLIARFGADRFDFVVSTEMLEHAADWRAAVLNMMAVTKPGGVLMVTTRSPGFGWHDYPSDHWRFTIADFTEIFRSFAVESLEPDPCHPGVNIMARKPLGWNLDQTQEHFSGLTVAPPP